MKQIKLFLTLILLVVCGHEADAQLTSNNACNAYCFPSNYPIINVKTPTNNGGNGVRPCGGLVEENPIWWAFRPSKNKAVFTLNIANCKNISNTTQLNQLTIFAAPLDCNGPFFSLGCTGGNFGTYEVQANVQPCQRYYLQLNCKAGAACDFLLLAEKEQFLKDTLEAQITTNKNKFCVGEVVSFQASLPSVTNCKPSIWKWTVEPEGYVNLIPTDISNVSISKAVIEFQKLPPSGTKLCIKATPIFNTTQTQECSPQIIVHCFEPEIMQLENAICDLTLKEKDLPYIYEIKNCLNHLDSIYKDSIVQNKTIIIDKNDFPIGKITSREYVYQINGFNCLGKLNLNVKVQPTNTLEFGIDNNVCGVKGQIVLVPIRVKNFKKIVDFQMSIAVKDTSVASIVGFASGLLNINSIVINSNVGNVLWYDSDVAGVDLADSAVIYYVKLRLNGVLNQNVAVEFDDRFLQMKAESITSDTFGSLFPIANNGSVCILKSIDVCGKIKREDNLPIANVEVNLQNASGVIKTTTTDKLGNYCFNNVIVNNDSIFTVKPRKIDNPKNGVTSGDMFRIQRHILGTELLNSAYKRLAADVDNTKTIASPDVAKIQQLILNKIKNFDGFDAWEFVPSIFDLGVDPFDKVIPKSIKVGTVQSTLNADFIGYKMADVNNSNIPNANPTPNLRTSNDVVLKLNANSEYGENGIFVNVTASQFRAIAAMQFSLNWNTAVLEFQGISGYNSLLNLGNANFNEQSEGELGFLWFERSGKTISLPDESTLFTLRFKVLEPLPNNIMIEFSNSPITINAENIEQELNTILHNCVINIKEILNTNNDIYNDDFFFIYPNPVANLLNIEVRKAISDNIKIELLNIDGKVVRFLEGNFNNQIASMDLNNLSSQVYILKISNNEDILLCQKVIKK